MRIYIVGSLRNPKIPELSEKLRCANHEVFDDWYSAGPEADDHLYAYERGRGHSCTQALRGHAVRNIFDFDKRHIDASESVVLVLPAGKSGHLELGYAIGSGKRGFILLDGEPERIDCMYLFAESVFDHVDDLIAYLGDGDESL